MNEKDTINRLKAENREYISILESLLKGLETATDQNEINELASTARKQLADTLNKSTVEMVINKPDNEPESRQDALIAMLDNEFAESINAKLALWGLIRNIKAYSRRGVHNLPLETTKLIESFKFSPDLTYTIQELDVMKNRFKIKNPLLLANEQGGVLNAGKDNGQALPDIERKKFPILKAYQESQKES